MWFLLFFILYLYTTKGGEWRGMQIVLSEGSLRQQQIRLRIEVWGEAETVIMGNFEMSC